MSKSNKFAIALPFFFDGKAEKYRKKYWEKISHYYDPTCDTLLLVMNATSEDISRIRGYVGDQARILVTDVPYSSYIARYILGRFATEEGYSFVYTTDDDENLTNPTGMTQTLLETYKFKSLEDIKIQLETEVIGLRHRKLRSNSKPEIEFKVIDDEEGNPTWASRLQVPNDSFYSIGTYHNKSFAVPTDRSTSRMQRGFLFKIGLMEKILREAESILLNKDNFTPYYLNFDDTIYPWVAYHGYGMNFRCVWSSEDPWDGDIHGGGSASVISSPSSPNGDMNRNFYDLDIIEGLLETHRETLARLESLDSIKDILLEFK